VGTRHPDQWRAGVAPANVVVIGAGVSGLAAATMAAGLHANVKSSTATSSDCAKSTFISTDGADHRVLDPRARNACLDADIVIGAVLVVGAKAPKLVSNDLVARMRPGSVLVDISVDQAVVSKRPIDDALGPVFEVNGSIFYCVANMPVRFRTRRLRARERHLALRDGTRSSGWREAVLADDALAEGVNVVEGAVTYGRWPNLSTCPSVHYARSCNRRRPTGRGR